MKELNKNTFNHILQAIVSLGSTDLLPLQYVWFLCVNLKVQTCGKHSSMSLCISLCVCYIQT